MLEKLLRVPYYTKDCNILVIIDVMCKVLRGHLLTDCFHSPCPLLWFCKSVFIYISGEVRESVGQLRTLHKTKDISIIWAFKPLLCFY